MEGKESEYQKLVEGLESEAVENQKLVQDLESKESNSKQKLEATVSRLKTVEELVEMLIDASATEETVEAELKDQLELQGQRFKKQRAQLEKDLTVVEAQRDGWRNTTMGLKKNFVVAQENSQEYASEIKNLKKQIEGQALGYGELFNEYMELTRRVMDFEDQIQGLKDAADVARDWSKSLYKKIDGAKKEARRARRKESESKSENKKLSQNLAFYHRERPGTLLEEGNIYHVPPHQKIFVGRSPFNHFFIPDNTVSRQHFQMFWSDSESYLQRNPGTDWGIKLNGEEIGWTRHPLEFGDIIQFGGERSDFFSLLFKWNKEAQQSELSFLNKSQLEKHLSGALASTRQDSSPGFSLKSLAKELEASRSFQLNRYEEQVHSNKTQILMVQFGEEMQQLFGDQASKMSSVFARLFQNVPELAQDYNPTHLLSLDSGGRKQLYLELVKKFHPDTHVNRKVFFDGAFRDIHSIFESIRKEAPVIQVGRIGVEGQVDFKFDRREESYFIGRDANLNHAILSDPLISYRHVEILFDSSIGWCVRDMGTKNGTLLQRPLDITEVEIKAPDTEAGDPLPGKIFNLLDQGYLKIGGQWFRYQVEKGAQSLTLTRTPDK